MKTIQLNSNNLSYWKKRAEPTVMALGFFDGIHHGHKKVIHVAAELAKEKKLSFSVMSFFPHPKTVLSNDSVGFDYLMPLSKKASILKSLGVDTFYVVAFNKDFLSLRPKEFVSHYLVNMGVVHAVAGFDFTYGYRGTGSVDQLKRDSNNQIEVTKVKKIDFYGKKISSTWIRELLFEGNMTQVANILGRFYETEVYWNGNCFQLAPYYMLPGAGYYKVVIKTKGKQRETEVFIPKRRDGIYLVENNQLSLFTQESLDMIWLHRISIEKEEHSESVLMG